MNKQVHLHKPYEECSKDCSEPRRTRKEAEELWLAAEQIEFRRNLKNTSLFQWHKEPITLHSGEKTNFKIDCDALTDSDILTLAQMALERLKSFSSIVSIPTGGDRLAQALEGLRGEEQANSNDLPILIVDDVYTTGASMEKAKKKKNAIGLVIFARSKPPEWITPLFTLFNYEEVICPYCVQWRCTGCKETDCSCSCIEGPNDFEPYWPDGSVATLTQEALCDRCKENLLYYESLHKGEKK